MWPKIGFGLSTGDIRVKSPSDDDVCTAFQAVSARNRGDGRLARAELGDFLRVLLIDMLPYESKHVMPLVSAGALAGTVGIGFVKHLVATRTPFVGEIVLRFLPSTFLLGPLLGTLAAFRMVGDKPEPERNSAAVQRLTRRDSGALRRDSGRGPTARAPVPEEGGAAYPTIFSGQAPRNANVVQDPGLYSPMYS